ncbi:MAG: DUF3800 domain-containing protein [Puniceicoccales bacterium]|jgi:hypothetical protein|nr:DUF3800 domain-containing protein [Puniceicoccales bacterium]
MPETLHSSLRSALAAFNGQPLREAALGFFGACGYRSARVLPINSLAELRARFDTDGLLTEANAALSRWRSIHFLFQLTDAELRTATEGALDLDIAEPYETKDIRSYLFFALDLEARPDGLPTTRKELSEITRALNRLVPQPILVLFRCGDLLSLAIINRRKNLRDGTRDVLTRVSLIRDIAPVAPHRAHLDLLGRFSLRQLRTHGDEIRTFTQLDNAWQKLFSIQELKDSFYRDLVTWFRWAAAEIKLARLPDHTPDDIAHRARATQEFTVRLICRTLFAWFLKEMRLIPAELLELYTITDQRRVLTRAPYDPESNHYYRGVLQNIFFQALNRPMDQRRKTGPAAAQDRTVTRAELKQLAYLGKNHLPETFDYDLFDRIPYLNGGLFDALPEDNASDTIDDGALRVPDKLFYATAADGFAIEVGGKKKAKYSTEGLNRILDRYRFTVAENTPLEEDVALDPELLGLVFENLLAEIDPDDKAAAESARKASGSYYTPRRIVDYMVNEALHLHLRTRFEQIGATRDDLQLLAHLCFESGEDLDFSPIAGRVVDILESTRVLDPACGSGAFPMGMLHRMVTLLGRVDPDNARWKQRLLDRLPAPMRDDASRGMEGKSYDYLRKLGVIQKNLYGVDIQPLAALIAKLRFFLTLVIEQDVQLADRAHNYGLQSLPNLETNLVCANTLCNAEHDLLAGPTLENLRRIREEYYQPGTPRERRDALALEIGGQLATLFPGFAEKTKGIHSANAQMRYEQDRQWLAEWFKHATVAAPFFNVETFFPELVGEGANRHPAPFHIVIGNPPYGGTKIGEELQEQLGLGSKDPYGAFIARFLGDPARPSPLAEGGVLAYIVSDTFMTIKAHRPLREQMLRHRVHKMIRVAGDTFKATVNCAVILTQRGPSTADHTCQMADLTNVSIHDRFEYFLHLLYQTEGTGPISRRQNVSNQTYAIYHYRQSLITTNSNLPFFVASPKLFALMNDTSAPVSHEIISGKRVPVRTITLNGNAVRLVKLRDIAEVKVGLQTGDNDTYLFQNPDARGSYRSIEDYRQYLLNEHDLERIRSDESLRREVVHHGISKDNRRSSRYFGGRYIVPYDKGGESDSDEGWMPNYWVPTNYFIDWSELAVNRMKTLTTRERNRSRGENGGNDSIASRFQNADSYFTKGITFSMRGVYSPTFRFAESNPFDVMSSKLFASAGASLDELLAWLASRLGKFVMKNYLEHTVAFDVDALKEVPIRFCPTEAQEAAKLVNRVMEMQRRNPRYDYASSEQLEIDRLVYAAYGLNETDIREVEDWYARRYPKLAKAQKENLAAKLGQTVDQLAPPRVVHLYCDESRHLPHDRESHMLLGLVSCPADKVRASHLELRDLARRHGLTDDYEMKWTHVRPGKLPFYEAVIDWFFARDYLSFRALLLPDKHEVYQRLPEDSQDIAYYRLYAQLLLAAMEPENRHRAFIDQKDTRGGHKIDEVQKMLRFARNDADGQTVQSLQQIQSHEARLLQLTDVLLGALGAARLGRTLPPPKQALVSKIAAAIGSPLVWDTAGFSRKFAISTFHDIDSLVS